MREKSFGFIFWLFFFVSFCLFWSQADENGKTRQTFVIRYRDENQTIPVTVVLDYKKQTEYVINMNPRTPAKSVTLYDFKQRTIAYKDLTNKECFLGRLTHETLSEESSALQDVKNPVEVKPKVRSLDPRMPALTPTEIRNIAGQKTAVFCRKMNTWLLMPEKTHNIHKREADEEFEEHTLQYHGHHSTQYSHYERQTRRKFRNRGHGNHRRRSRAKEGVAEKENGKLTISEQNKSPHFFKKQSFNTPYHEQLNGASDSSRLSPPPNYGLSHRQFSSTQGNAENKNENFNSNVPLDKEIIHRPDINQNHLRESNEYQPSDGISIYTKRNYLNSSETGDALFSNHDLTSDITKKIPGSFDKDNYYFARLRSDGSETEIKSVTTISPEFLNQLRTDHPNVHSSLLHLLPLYKPLGREFDFPEKTETKNQSTIQYPTIKQTNVESEAHNSSTPFILPVNKFTHLTDVNSTVYDPDVSVNVLEIPKITKEFENIQTNNSYAATSQFNNKKQLHGFSNIYPPVAESHSIDSEAIHNKPLYSNNTYLGHISKNVEIDSRNYDQHSESDVFTTTEFPVLTTHKIFIPEKTTPDTSYVPSVHTAFQNLEDFNTFQIFPNYIENNIPSTSTEINSNTQSSNTDKIKNLNAAEILQDLILTTNHPVVQETAKTISNQRSDIPSEDSNDKTASNHVPEQKPLHLGNYNRTEDYIFPQKVRYQNALRDFKPDEIVIDIENIPTHTPTPVTASFQQRILTTIQPIFRVSSAKNVKEETTRRAEQTSVTSWRSLVSTTRFPRRRMNDKSRVSAQSSSDSFVHRNAQSHHRNRFPSPQLNQLTGMRHFSPVQTHHRQFFYSGHPLQPPNVGISPEINQLHHANHMNNLPPGVSVHPRHPQAPFADMIHSNRPPTMPILNDSQEPLKPHHRQRHHRKKDRLLHSCCRLHGNSGALQSCCRNGGPCCSRSHRFVQPSNCCSSLKVNRQIIPANQIQPNIRTTNKILPSIRTEKTHRSEIDNKNRCQKEKMCRTLYESTQQVMVCRNAHVEGC